MQLTVLRNAIYIGTDDPMSCAFIEDTLKLKEVGDYVLLRRIEPRKHPHSDQIILLKTESIEAQKDTTT